MANIRLHPSPFSIISTPNPPPSLNTSYYLPFYTLSRLISIVTFLPPSRSIPNVLLICHFGKCPRIPVLNSRSLMVLTCIFGSCQYNSHGCTRFQITGSCSSPLSPKLQVYLCYSTLIRFANPSFCIRVLYQISSKSHLASMVPQPPRILSNTRIWTSQLFSLIRGIL